MPASVVRIALIQHACGLDPSGNVDRAVELIREAAASGARVVVTQELFSSRYFPQAEDAGHFSLAQGIPGPLTERLAKLARELSIELVASLFEKRVAGIYHNTAVLFAPDGSLAGLYRKMHIPDDPMFYEKFYFTPGDASGAGVPRGEAEPFPVFGGREARLGVLVCWDQWFPEAARLAALRGAQILFYPTAIAYCQGEPAEVGARQREAWITVQRAHAIANGMFVAAVNRVGKEGDLRFWGSSFVADPSGAIIAQADENEERVLLADCDLSLIESTRQAWPFLRDRRVDAYEGLTRRFLDEPPVSGR